MADGSAGPSVWDGLRGQIYLGDERFVNRMLAKANVPDAIRRRCVSLRGMIRAVGFDSLLAPSKDTLMIVVTNRVPVAAGHEFDFEDHFRRRVHLIDRAPCFIRNVVHRPRPVRFDHESGVWADDPDTPGCYEIKTWWRSFGDFVAWTDSPALAEAHSNRPPKEMFAGPSKLGVREVFVSPDLEDR